MSLKISEFPGIDPNHVIKLREAGIENTDDLMRLWSDQPKRASLAQKADLSIEQLTKFAAMARLARVKTLGTKYIEVLVAAGIDGPKSLFEYTPEALMKRLEEVVAEKKLAFPMPTPVEVGAWFVDVKPVVGAA
jgi:predicted RecB family nuclease